MTTHLTAPTKRGNRTTAAPDRIRRKLAPLITLQCLSISQVYLYLGGSSYGRNAFIISRPIAGAWRHHMTAKLLTPLISPSTSNTICPSARYIKEHPTANNITTNPTPQGSTIREQNSAVDWNFVLQNGNGSSAGPLMLADCYHVVYQWSRLK